MPKGWRVHTLLLLACLLVCPFSAPFLPGCTVPPYGKGMQMVFGGGRAEECCFVVFLETSVLCFFVCHHMPCRAIHALPCSFFCFNFHVVIFFVAGVFLAERQMCAQGGATQSGHRLTVGIAENHIDVSVGVHVRPCKKERGEQRPCRRRECKAWCAVVISRDQTAAALQVLLSNFSRETTTVANKAPEVT